MPGVPVGIPVQDHTVGVGADHGTGPDLLPVQGEDPALVLQEDQGFPAGIKGHLGEKAGDLFLQGRKHLVKIRWAGIALDAAGRKRSPENQGGGRQKTFRVPFYSRLLTFLLETIVFEVTWKFL